METMYATIDHDRIPVQLLSLDEYEDPYGPNGCYDDSGNGGEKVDRAEFLCAVRIEDDYGYDHVPILRALGVGDYWADTAAAGGPAYLLREWPEEMPLHKRVNVG